ncbi:MAG: hypothetical protein JXA24_00855, partial [Proteobacteria bacterium]|nr:hypothetical protein [Pseudomonadota bacterium]
CDACLDTAEGIDVDEDGCELPVEDTQDDSADDASADDEIVDTDGDGTPDSEDVCPDDPTDGCVEEFPVYDLDDSKDAANEDWFAADGGCSLVPAAQPNVMMLIFLVLGFMPLALKRSR